VKFVVLIGIEICTQNARQEAAAFIHTVHRAYGKYSGVSVNYSLVHNMKPWAGWHGKASALSLQRRSEIKPKVEGHNKTPYITKPCRSP
jgi:uncharacterized phage-associated protein